MRQTFRGLSSPKEAAEYLRISTKTLIAHVDDGAIQYINVGRGSKKRRIMFTEADLDEFIERRAQRNVPCRSTSTKAARSTTSISSSKVIGFTALRDARTSERLMSSSATSASARKER